MYTTKYCPRNLDGLTHNKKLTELLKKISKTGIRKIQNYIFYGPNGSGKKTRIMCFLNDLINDKIYNVKLGKEYINNNEIPYVISDYHIEINLSNFPDKSSFMIFVDKFISNIFCDIYRIVIITGIKNSAIANTILPFIIQTKYKTARFIIIINKLSDICEKIKSSCIALRVASPSDKDIYDILYKIAENERIQINKRIINIIIRKSSKITLNNLKHIINTFQLSYLKGKYIKYDTTFSYNFNKICKIIDKPISSDNIYKIRNVIYDIYTNNSNTNELIYYIYKTYVDKIDDKKEFIDRIINCDNLLIMGNKDPIYIEYLIYYVISKINI